jgi:hypothetical protein
MNGVFPTGVASGFFMQLTILNILNPATLNLGTFVMTIFKGATIYYPLASGSSVAAPTLTYSNMPYTVTLMDSSLWATTPITFTFTPNTLLDTIIFSFPTQWTNETAMFQTLFLLPTCTSIAYPTIACNLVNPYYTVTNLQYYTAGQPIDITINSIYNPTSVASIGTIFVLGQLGGIQVTEADVAIPSSSFSNDILRDVTLATSYLAGDQLTLLITFTFAHAITNSDIFMITFPSDFSMSISASNYNIVGSYTATQPALNFFPLNQSIIFSPFMIAYATQATLNITIMNIARPR